MNRLLEKFRFTPDMERILSNSPSIIVPESKETLYELIFGNEYTDTIEVNFDVKGKLVKDLPNADGAAIAELNEYFGIRAE